MGNTDTKLNFRKAVVQLTTKTQPVEAGDEAFWDQFWSDSVTCVQDVFTLIPAAEIRALREESPSNLATLCYKAVEKLVTAAENGCRTAREQQTVLNCVRLLTRILPYIFEDPDWRGFFWSTLPGQSAEDAAEHESSPLAQSLLGALSDLLFCPDFSVAPNRKTGPDNPEDIHTIDSCEYIWEAGVGFAHTPPVNSTFDQHRSEILRLLLTCFSETMYLPPVADAHTQPNQWISFFTSTENRHALPLFTSMLNVACAYDPVGYMPYNHWMFSDFREPLVEASLQVLCVTLDNDPTTSASVDGTSGGTAMDQAGDDLGASEVGGPDNLFVNYMSRIHREEDFAFILKGLTRLLNNPLAQTYLPGSTKKIQFHQELLVLFWKMCDINKKFMFYVLKSSDVLDILVPILFHLNDARADQSRVGLMHIGVFILLLLSGERNFGVRLNKPYTVRIPMDIPVFTGTHADFLIIVFHKIITTGHQRLQPLFDCLLTIIVNVSPYLKTLSMVASTKLLHLLEAFSTPWFLYASPTNHHLVFFLLEVFNNIIQYQFDGNANLVYTIIRKRNVFHQLANLPTDHSAITKALTKRGRKMPLPASPVSEQSDLPMEGSRPATEAEPGTLKATLAATPVFGYSQSEREHQGSLDLWYDFEAAVLPSTSFLSTTYRHDTLCTTEKEAFMHEDSFDLSVDDDYEDIDDPWESALNLTSVSPLSEAYNPPEESDEEGIETPTLKPSIIAAKFMNIPEKRAKLVNALAKLGLNQQDIEDSDNQMVKQVVRKLTVLEVAKQIAHKEESETKNRISSILLGIEKMTEKSPASVAHSDPSVAPLATHSGTESIQPGADVPEASRSAPVIAAPIDMAPSQARSDSPPDGQPEGQEHRAPLSKTKSLSTPPASPTMSSSGSAELLGRSSMLQRASSISSSQSGGWVATSEWVGSWKQKLPLQTIMRLLQVLVPQVEKICIDKGLTDESEILKFLQHGTLVGLLPVPHPILIRKYQANSGTTMWFRTYMWGVIYLRNVDPPVWYDTDVKLFEIQRV